MKRRSWSDDEIEMVRRMYCREAIDDAEIAKALGRTRSSISSIRDYHSIHRPAELLKRASLWSPEDMELAKAMYAYGLSTVEIANKIARTPTAIRRAVTMFGWSRDSVLRNPSDFDTADEVWRRLDVCADVAVSSFGRVRKLTPDYKVYSSWVDLEGYAHVTLRLRERKKRFSVHRLVALAFLGPPPTARHQVAHNDGNPGNNTVENLRWATAIENQRDRLLHGTAPRKENGRFVKTKRAPAADADGAEMQERLL